MKTAALLATVCGLCLAFVGQASAAEEFDKYAVQSVSSSLSSNQAGAHADMTIAFKLTSEGEKPFAFTRDLFITLPPGVIGNPQNLPRCTIAELGEEPKKSECPQDSQVGISEVTLNELGTLVEPVYNMPPPQDSDIVARFGLFAGLYPAVINIRVNPIDYSLTAAVEGAPAAAELVSASTTIWGVPAAASHDELRLTPLEAAGHETPVGGRPSGQPEIPFLSNPTDCSLKREVSVKAVSYQLPSAPSTISAPFPQIVGCQKLSFNPSLTVTPTNPEAFAPTGLDATLTVPQDEAPKDLATSTMKSAVVTLPEGLAINPAAGDGLEGCSAAEIGFETTEPSHCPDAAKIGSVELEVPALERTLNGSVYQRTPEEGKLFRFWLVSDEQGVHLKLPAEIQANEATGQLTNLFLGIPSLGGNPQVPFSQLRLHVFGGPRAPLATPACGAYSTHYAFAPWSGKAASEGDTAMQITSGCGKGGFVPGLRAGTVSLRAGSYSPFALTLTRQDGEANPSQLSLHLPEGLLAKLGGVPLCPEASAAAASCPAASQVGTLATAAGVGSSPLWIPQPGKAPTAVYLAGPYKGAPYSIIAKVPAQAGPFDLGTVVNRSAIDVDPETATATITTDPLPQILAGVPIAYRALHVDVNRPQFTLNPTNCEAKKIEATVTSSGGATATPSAGFQATNCARLPFKPRLSLTLKGATHRRAHPALTATLKARRGDANIASAQVKLPASAFLDNAHIATVCTRVQFKADACPAASIYGHAEARTPLLDYPLTGPVLLRSSDHPLPDLVVDLRGPTGIPLRVALAGRTDSVKGALRNSFEAVPDVPVTKFSLSLFGGKRGLIEMSSGFCKRPNATIAFAAQNGRTYRARPVVGSGCGKKK